MWRSGRDPSHVARRFWILFFPCFGGLGLALDPHPARAELLGPRYLSRCRPAASGRGRFPYRLLTSIGPDRLLPDAGAIRRCSRSPARLCSPTGDRAGPAADCALIVGDVTSLSRSPGPGDPDTALLLTLAAASTFTSSIRPPGFRRLVGYYQPPCSLLLYLLLASLLFVEIGSC